MLHVPHSFVITLIERDSLLEEVLKELSIPPQEQNAAIVLEKIRTLLTVYTLHKESYAKKEEVSISETSTPPIG